MASSNQGTASVFAGQGLGLDGEGTPSLASRPRCHNLVMSSTESAPRVRLASDTTAVVEALQIERWRAMSSVEIAALVSGAYRAMRTMAMAGLRERFPHAGDDEMLARFAALTLGEDTARRVYPQWFDGDRA